MGGFGCLAEISRWLRTKLPWAANPGPLFFASTSAKASIRNPVVPLGRPSRFTSNFEVLGIGPIAFREPSVWFSNVRPPVALAEITFGVVKGGGFLHFQKPTSKFGRRFGSGFTLGTNGRKFGVQIRKAFYLFIGRGRNAGQIVIIVGIFSLIENREYLIIFPLGQWIKLVAVTFGTTRVSPIHTCIVVSTRSFTAAIRNSSLSVPPSVLVMVLR